MLPVDHLVYAVPDFQNGLEAVEELLGVRATPGGQHPNWGTRNALIALGPDIYLEIIGPDPELPPPPQGRVFGIDELDAPGLVTWAAKASELKKQVAQLSEKGLQMGKVRTGSRTKPDGELLSWQLTDPYTVLGDGLIPFLIDWGDSPHPARNAVKGGQLLELRAEHPRPAEINALLKVLDIDLPVRKGTAPRLTAIIQTPGENIRLQ